jgi:4-hydroxy-3-polyprenylbenzoate decarboxylase
MRYDDLRDWLGIVEGMGELKRLGGAHWNLEIGAITDVVHHTEPSPALVFDEIPDYPPGRSILVNAMHSRNRLAVTMGLPTGLKDLEIVAQLRQKIASIKPIPPNFVQSGSICENVLTGKSVDITKFPAPKWHEHDGGRYIGTGCIVFTQDPDEGWVNLGTYRVMVHDRETLGLYISPGKHGRIHRDKCFARGAPLKVAIALGNEPLLFLGSCMEMPHGVSEYDYIGGWRGAPVDVVKGEFTGLPIPAGAEIVVEGECLPDTRKEEGPFGEFTGYYASAVRDEPVVKIKAIYHRHNPIILGYPPSKPPNEMAFVFAYYRSAMIWDELERAGVPDVRGVWTDGAGAARMFTVVAIRQRYAGHSRQAGLVAANCHANAYLGRFTIVVDDDVEIANLHDVIWALSTRCDPASSCEVISRCWSGPLDPIIPKGAKGFNSRMIIDACRPFEWRSEFPRTVGIDQQEAEKVIKKWGAKIF